MTLYIGARYRHFKGNEYKTLHLAYHSETEEPLVVYQALYGERKIWARPLRSFCEDVRENVPRFLYLEGGEPVEMTIP